MRYAVLGLAYILVGLALVSVAMHPVAWLTILRLASLLVGLALLVFAMVKSIPRWRDARAVPFGLALMVVLGLIDFVNVYWLPSPFFSDGPSPLRLATHAENVEGSDRLTGVMIRLEECVMVVDPDLEQVLPTWPVGYTYERWSHGGGLSGPAGANLVVENEKITLVGQRVGWDEPRPVTVHGLSDDCGPIDLWFVAEVSVPFQP